MKKAIIIFLLLLFITPSLALAKPSFTQNNAQGVEKPTLPERPKITRAPLPSKMAEVREKLQERRKHRIREFFNRMVNRLKAAAERLKKLIARIESRLAKLENEGKDVTKIKSEVNEAKTKLAKAEGDMELAQNTLETFLASDNPKETFKEVINLIKGIKTQLIEVHQILVHIIGDIKGLGVQETMPKPTPSATETI